MSYFDGKLKISVASASGIEAITKSELQKLGYMPGGAINGRISIDGNMRDVARCNMFLRTAGRVRIVVGEFDATTFDELFDNINDICWEDILPLDAKVNITAKSVKSTLFAISAIQSVSKKAIVERMKEKRGVSTMCETGAVYAFEVSILSDEVSIALDTTGNGLHKRGYRTLVGEAPLRETTAAAMLMLSNWKWDRPLIDPFVGSGTIPIEAALIATNTAPGINRDFAFEQFDGVKNVADDVRTEANELVIRDRKLRISGFDIDKRAIRLANFHVEQAGMKDFIHFQTSDMRTISSRFAYGAIVTNPPYGIRLSKGDELFELYRSLGKMFFTLDEWSAFVITSCMSFEKHFGKRADQRRTLYNSELACNFFSYFGKLPSRIENQEN